MVEKHEALAQAHKDHTIQLAQVTAERDELAAKVLAMEGQHQGAVGHVTAVEARCTELEDAVVKQVGRLRLDVTGALSDGVGRRLGNQVLGTHLVHIWFAAVNKSVLGVVCADLMDTLLSWVLS